MPKVDHAQTQNSSYPPIEDDGQAAISAVTRLFQDKAEMESKLGKRLEVKDVRIILREEAKQFQPSELGDLTFHTVAHATAKVTLHLSQNSL